MIKTKSMERKCPAPLQVLHVLSITYKNKLPADVAGQPLLWFWRTDRRYGVANAFTFKVLFKRSRHWWDVKVVLHKAPGKDIRDCHSVRSGNWGDYFRTAMPYSAHLLIPFRGSFLCKEFGSSQCPILLKYAFKIFSKLREPPLIQHNIISWYYQDRLLK